MTSEDEAPGTAGGTDPGTGTTGPDPTTGQEVPAWGTPGPSQVVPGPADGSEPEPAPAPAPGPATGAVPPVRPRRSARAGALAALAVLLAGALVAVVVTRGGSGTLRTAGPGSTWPTAPAESPPTPGGERPWAGTAPPLTTPPPSPVDAAATATGTSTAGQAGFCVAARQGLASVGGQGLEVLKTLVTRAGDTAPQARAFVTSAVQQADQLRRSAPEVLTEAVGTLQQAWQGLSSELEKAGYGRAEVTLLSIKYLADPAVAAATEAVGRWAAERCGVDLLGVRDAGG